MLSGERSLVVLVLHKGRSKVRSAMKYVIVTGSREFDHERVLHAMLEDQLSESRQLFLVVGDCPTGADKFAKNWAFNRLRGTDWTYDRVDGKEFVAHWDRKCDEKCYHPPKFKPVDGVLVPYCPVAGHLRNQEMVDFVLQRMNTGDTAIGLAFLKTGAQNKGTRDCRGRMRKAKIRVTSVYR